jgi:TonB family protein
LVVRLGLDLLSASTRLLVLAAVVTCAGAGVASSAQEPSKDIPAPPASPAPPTRIRVGGNVLQAKMLHMVQPLYPAVAIAGHISGTVVLHAIIGRDGTVQQVEYVSGPPLLLKASMEAVKQWVYEPTTLNGHPVEVDSTISVVFTLGDGNGAPPPASSPPPTPVGAPPLGEASNTVLYSDSIEGIKAQTQAVFEAWRSEYKDDYFKALHDFAMPDPKAWLMETFGAEKAAELLPLYETGLQKFEAHMTRVSEFWAKSPASYLIVETSPPPPPLEGSDKEPLTKPLVPLQVESFRFSVKTGQEDPPGWVFSFVYLNGRFRGVGGTYSFWDDDWRNAHYAKAGVGIRTRSSEPGFEGVAVDCPEPGLLRVFISPKAQALRLKDKVEPVYPEAAKKAGIEGTVLFQAIIAADGTVAELTLEDGDPLLAIAAEEAVRKWRYDTTTHRGRIAEVDTVVAVEFKLPR